MNTRVEQVLNTQINREYHSAYLYLSMCAYFEEENLDGFSNFMRVQYQEEVSHAMKFFDYIIERGGRVKLQPVEAVKTNWNGIIEVFEDTLKHEKYITKCINELLEVAYEEKDYATINMLQWYVAEQVEEEANVSSILQQLKMIDGKGAGLFMLDREMKNRSFVDTTKE